MKQFKLTFVLTILMSMVGLQAFADWDISTKVYVNGLNYYLDKDNNLAQVTKSSGTGSITIPSTFNYQGNTYSVTSIEGYAFYGCSGLTSITIPNSVTSIGSHAFYNTAWYDNKPDGLIYAGLVAYEYKGTMPANTSITIKEGTLGISSSAFYNCSRLTSIDIPNSVTSIEEDAFYNCSGLTSVTIPNSVTSIKDEAFKFCSGLTSVTIGNSMTSIGSYAFYGCSNLTSVIIPNSVTSIRNNAFSGCANLIKVELKSNAVASKTYSESSTIERIFGSQVKEYIMGDGVTSIGDYAFYKCSGLESVTILSSVTSIGNYAFYNCSGLESVTIPSSVTSIGPSAFSNCSGLTEVHITDLEAWCKIKFGRYDSNPLYYAHHIYLNDSEIKDLVIPNSVTEIGYSAFYGCSGLTSIEIPNSVTSIGGSAFYNCSGLTSVTIPNSVTSIGSSAFSNTNLSTLIVGTGVLSFGTDAFSTRPVKTIWLTNTPPRNYTVAQGNVNYVANSQYSSLSNVKEYKFLSSMFEADGIKYVPVSPSERTCDVIDCVYDDSITEVSINPTVSYRNVNMKVQNVQPYTFYQNTNIKKANIDIESSIGKYVFSGCNNLQTAVFGKNVTGIGEHSFSDCSKLESIIIPELVDTIGQYAFSNCSGMKSVVMGEGTNIIGQCAFSGCSSLSSVTIGKGTNSIGNYAFSGCTKLESISLGEGTETINQYAFQNCSSLPSITIPGSVNSIGNYAFNGCKGLKTVIMEDRKTDGELKLGYNGSNPLFVNCPLDSVYIGRNISYSTGSSYGYSPFYRNTSLRAVVITDKETDISENEFYGCTNLQNVQIGDGVTAIGNWAFSGCSSLKNFSFGTHVKTIGKEAFSDCTAVTAITSKAQTPPVCSSQALDDINKWDCVLYVPEGYASSYQNADQWKEFFFIEEKKFDLRGDANGDGEVGMPDVMFIVNYILGTPDASFNTEAADANLDGQVGMPDVMFIVNKILNGKFPDEK